MLTRQTQNHLPFGPSRFFSRRSHVGLGVSFGPFDAMGKVTAYYKDQCARWGWQPEPHQIIYRANNLIAETGEKAQQALAQYSRQAVFPLKAAVAAGLLELDQRNEAVPRTDRRWRR